MKNKSLTQLGEPDIKLAGLRLWIHGYQFEAEDYWDGNWLNVTAHCSAEGASVFTSGPIVHLSELHTWSFQCEQMYSALSGEAKLECMEPELAVSLKAENLGHITMEVSITPNNLKQRHWFQYDIDQSYLTQLIAQCREIFRCYPMKGDFRQ
jgi:hypothetical protein